MTKACLLSAKYSIYFQIKETEPCCYKAMHRCGFFSPFSLTVTGRIITISFASDNSLNAKGFNMTWKGTHYFKLTYDYFWETTLLHIILFSWLYFIVLVQETPVTNAFTKTSWSSDISTKLPLTRTKNPEASTERNTTIGTQLSNWDIIRI